MTRYYLLDHPPASQQFYPPPRANGLTGGIVLHTTESPKQRIGADNGAINIAAFISRRSDPGSYHCIVDSGSTVLLVPDNYTAFHVAANGYNSRTWGISFACRSTELALDDEWTQLAMKQAAAAIVAFWQRNRFDPAACRRDAPRSRRAQHARAHDSRRRPAVGSQRRLDPQPAPAGPRGPAAR